MKVYLITLVGAVENGQRVSAWRLVSVEAWALVGWLVLGLVTVWWWRA